MILYNPQKILCLLWIIANPDAPLERGKATCPTAASACGLSSEVFGIRTRAFVSGFRISKMETHSAFLIWPAFAVVRTHRENFPLCMFLRSWGLCPSSLYCICPCPLSLLFVIIFPLFPILFRTLIIASVTPTGNSGTTRKFEMC